MRTSSLSKSERIFFPLSLTLFEFIVYIANDMIQPAMLEVVANFNAGVKWNPTSMTAFLAWDVFLQWLFGPLSDRRSRLLIMFISVLFFIISCLAILLVSNIEQFIAMRFLQGIGLCSIGSVGYATIQEAFQRNRLRQNYCTNGQCDFDSAITRAIGRGYLNQYPSSARHIYYFCYFSFDRIRRLILLHARNRNAKSGNIIFSPFMA